MSALSFIKYYLVLCAHQFSGESIRFNGKDKIFLTSRKSRINQIIAQISCRKLFTAMYLFVQDFMVSK